MLVQPLIYPLREESSTDYFSSLYANRLNASLGLEGGQCPAKTWAMTVNYLGETRSNTHNTVSSEACDPELTLDYASYYNPGE